jgi:hypothetical protein
MVKIEAYTYVTGNGLEIVSLSQGIRRVISKHFKEYGADMTPQFDKVYGASTVNVYFITVVYRNQKGGTFPFTYKITVHESV